MKQTILCFVTLYICIAFGYYEIILERVTYSNVDPEYMEVNDFSVKKINRTTFAFNTDLNLLQDVQPKWEIDVVLFAMFSNVYKQMPFVIKRKLCDIFKYEYKFIKSEIDRSEGNFPLGCPIKKGHIYFKNFIPNGKHFPRAIPWKKVMIKMTFKSDKNKPFLILDTYATFDHDAEIAKSG